MANLVYNKVAWIFENNFGKWAETGLWYKKKYSICRMMGSHPACWILGGMFMNEQLLKMNGLSVEIPNALSFKAHLWHEFKAVLNNVLSGSERSSIGVRPHKGVTRRKIVCYFFITILRIHAFQKKIWNPF